MVKYCELCRNEFETKQNNQLYCNEFCGRRAAVVRSNGRIKNNYWSNKAVLKTDRLVNRDKVTYQFGYKPSINKKR